MEILDGASTSGVTLPLAPGMLSAVIPFKLTLQRGFSYLPALRCSRTSPAAQAVHAWC